MTLENPSKNGPGTPKGRLESPILRLVSILIAIAAIGVFLFSLIRISLLIPVVTAIIFLILWFSPFAWNWIEFVFSKRPSSRLGKFILNFVLAILTASVLEDILDLLVELARTALRILKSL